MKKHLVPLILAALLVLVSCGTANKAGTGTATAAKTSANAATAEKRYQAYAIGFYNLENLFDTVHDYAPDGSDKNDYEYLPDGKNRWNGLKYTSKLKNMSTVLSQLGTSVLPGGCCVVGVTEIENRRVLEDLLQQPALKDRNWQIAHVESPDYRGIDCALLYDPTQFQMETISYPLYWREDGSLYHTRGFLTVGGLLAGERVHFIVNHWPSRFADSPARERAGLLVREVKDSILAVYPGSSVIVMGDLNDDPDDKSLTEGLGAKKTKAEVTTDDGMFNPWWKTLRDDGVGTLKYDGKWNLFDQIVLSGHLVNGDRTSLEFWKNEIFVRDYLIQQEGKYKGNPLRTAASGVWMNGYSDHLPTTVYLVKEVK